MMLKSPLIRSLFASGKGRNGSLPVPPGNGPTAPDGDAAASSPRAGMLQRLEGELHEQLQSLLSLEQELEERRTALAAYEETIAGQRAELGAAREALAEAERERDAANGELARARAELKEARRRGDEANRRAESEASGATRLRAVVQELTLECDELRALDAGHKEQLLNLQDTIVGLEHVAAERQAALEERARELSALAARVNELERGAAEMRGRLQELESANAKLQAIATEGGKTIERLAGELRAAEARVEQLTREITGASDAERALRAALAAAESANAQLQEKLAETASTLAATREELVPAVRLRELEALLEQEQSVAAGLRAEIDRRDDRIDSLTRAAEEAAREQERARAAVADLELKLEALSAQHEKSVAALQGEWESVAEENDNLNRELAGKNAEAAALRQEIGQLHSGRESLANENDALRQLIEELEIELRNKRLLIASLERESGRRNGFEAQPRAEDDSQPGDATSTFARPRALVAIGDPKVRYPLLKPSVVIGRASDCDIRIGGSYTSRHHARIVTDALGTSIEDLDSINGIQVNAENVKSCRLSDGDLVQIGKNLFVFADPQDAPVPVTEEPSAAEQHAAD